MTDELSIQQQPRQNGNYAVPGMVGGALIGGAGGVAGAHYKNWGITRKPTEEDLKKLFSQEPDSFNGKIEKSKDDLKSFYETAKTEVQKVKDAEAEFNKIVEEAKKSGVNLAELPNGDIKTNLKNAEEAFNNALNAEKNKLGNTVTQKVTNIPTAEEVKNLGSKVSLNDVKTYDTLYSNYLTALKNAKQNANYGDLEQFKNTIDDGIRDIYRTSTTPKKKLLPNFTHKQAINQCVDILKSDIEKFIPEIDASTPKGLNHIKYELKKAGKNYKIGGNKYNRFVKELNAPIRAEREALLKEILGEKITVDIVDPKTKKVTGHRISYKNVERFIKNEEAEFNRMVNFEKKLPKGLAYDAINTSKYYENELSKLEKNTSITRKAYNQQKNALEQMLSLAKDKEVIETAKVNRINRFFSEISKTKDIEAKIEKAINQDSSVQSSLQKLKNFASKNDSINELLTETVTESNLSAEEIETKAREAVSKMKVHTDYEAAKKAAEEELQRLGKGKELSGDALTEAIKKKAKGAATVEEYTNALKEDAMKVIKEKAEKAKIANKTWTGLALAVGVGLVGTLIGAASKKSAPEEEIA